MSFSRRNILERISFFMVLSMVMLVVACDQKVTENPEGEVGSVEVVYNGTTVTVDLADVAIVTLDDGEEYARLSDVVDAADLGVALTELEFDFEGADGFRSSSTSTCVDHIPAPGSILSQGYVHRITRNMEWDEAAEMPGCTHVHELARIYASDVGTARTDVEVLYDGSSYNVDLRSLETVEFQGSTQVRLADIVDWASLGVATVNLEFDFESADGFHPSNSANCADFVPVAGAELSDGYVDLATRNLSWDDAAGFPGCLNVDDLVRIHATEREVTGPSVEVIYNGATVIVALADAEAVDFEGTEHVQVTELITLASLGVDIADLVFDFEAADGFRPSSSTNCAELFPIAGDLLSHGYLELSSRNLAWAEAAALPGCAFVDDVAVIHVEDAEATVGPFVDVVYGETTVTVDLGSVEVSSFRGEPHVRLSDAVAAAELGVETTSLIFDFISADGFRASSSDRCAGFVPTAGSLLVDGYINLETRDLDWEDALGMPGCARIDNLATIEATDAE